MTSDDQETAQHQSNIGISAGVDQPEVSLLSEVERSKRKEAVAFANASTNLSAFEITDSMKRLGERYISGEIDLEDFVATTRDENAQ
ncbi:MAG: antitoxin VbhA family protein [Pseudomonas sp.]|uniref:antitoxin VbhA family protein n=1 Tax=Pseudomonas sp. TaxID=306 RepID=UPI001A39240E|nr:antitoxin VbhA family protein [Pseudomonas sp.]MBL7230686.1 antitoxin VbhA family protein [Pseudomonas sp.]